MLRSALVEQCVGQPGDIRAALTGQRAVLIEDLPRGPRWDMAAGYLEGMISLYNRRFGDEAPMIPPYRPPFSDTPFPGTE